MVHPREGRPEPGPDPALPLPFLPRLPAGSPLHGGGAEPAATETDPSGACNAFVVRTTFPSSTRSAVTDPAPSSRILSVETREPARYRATVATVAPASRSVVITPRRVPLADTR